MLNVRGALAGSNFNAFNNKLIFINNLNQKLKLRISYVHSDD